MSKSESGSAKKKENSIVRWVISIFFVTIAISASISFISEELMSVSGIALAFVILLFIVFIGIIFDIIGVAVTSADESPFHAMAARKVAGAREAIRLLRKAERVSSICNDVIGDICGVVSGSASAAIAAQVLSNGDFSWPRLITLAMSSLVAGLTVGGKAIGKSLAVNSSTKIVFAVGKVVYRITHIGELFKKKKQTVRK